MARRFFPLFLVVTALGCNGPVGFFAGGMLDGQTTPVPPAWALAESRGVAQLETNPAAPYSVNVAYTVLEKRLYVNAGDTETQWVNNIAANPSVRLRIDDAIYDLDAERVTDEGEIRVFGDAWASQSSFYRNPADLDEAWVYRLVPRR